MEFRPWSDRLLFPSSPVEDVVLHSESSSLSESGASHDNGENCPPPVCPLRMSVGSALPTLALP